MSKLLELKDLRQLVARNSDSNGELNAALIVSAAIWGVKASELSLIEVSDVLTAKGQLMKKWLLRSEIAFNGCKRELYTEHESLVDYLNAYIVDRASKKLHVTNSGEYLSLDPKSKLFLDPAGNEFKFSRRESNNTINMQPVGINSYFKKLIINAGLVGVTFKDFRRSLAIQMHREGGRKTGVIKDIMTYLGIRSYSAVRKLLNSDPKMLHDMVKGIHKRI